MDAYKQLDSKCIQLQAELEEEKFNSNKYYESFKRQAEELKDTLISVDDLLKVKDFLEKTVNKLTEENISLETNKTEMEARVSKL